MLTIDFKPGDYRLFRIFTEDCTQYLFVESRFVTCLETDVFLDPTPTTTTCPCCNSVENCPNGVVHVLCETEGRWLFAAQSHDEFYYYQGRLSDEQHQNPRLDMFLPELLTRDFPTIEANS